MCRNDSTALNFKMFLGGRDDLNRKLSMTMIQVPLIVRNCLLLHLICSLLSARYQQHFLRPQLVSQDVERWLQHTEDETILGDLHRLDSWCYCIEWLASLPIVCLLLVQILSIYEYLGSFNIVLRAERKCWCSCTQTHWHICILCPDAQINYLEGWENMSIPWKVQSSGHSRLHCIL